MPDKDIRRGGANQPVPHLTTLPSILCGSRSRRGRVAIVTTAALRTVDQTKWTGRDQSFRVLGPGTEGLILGHISPNYEQIRIPQ